MQTTRKATRIGDTPAAEATLYTAETSPQR
jgi:hypothetical protein